MAKKGGEADRAG